MATKARTAHRDEASAWFTAGFLVLALAVVPAPGHEANQRSVTSVLEAGPSSPASLRAVPVVQTDQMRRWGRDHLDDANPRDSPSPAAVAD